MNTEDNNVMKEHAREYLVDKKGLHNPSFLKKESLKKNKQKKNRNIVVNCIICTVVPEGQITCMWLHMFLLTIKEFEHIVAIILVDAENVSSPLVDGINLMFLLKHTLGVLILNSHPNSYWTL